MNKRFYLYTSLPLTGITIPKQIRTISGSILCIEKVSDLEKLNSSSSGKKYTVAVLGKNPESTVALKTYIATRLKFPKSNVLYQSSRSVTKEALNQIIKIGYDGIVWKGSFNQLHSFISDFPDLPKPSLESNDQIQTLRKQIDVIDEKLLNDLSKRSELVKKLGSIKSENGIAIVQPLRWKELLKDMIHLSTKKKLPESFIYAFMELIHLEAIKQQLDQK